MLQQKLVLTKNLFLLKLFNIQLRKSVQVLLSIFLQLPNFELIHSIIIAIRQQFIYCCQNYNYHLNYLLLYWIFTKKIKVRSNLTKVFNITYTVNLC